MTRTLVFLATIAAAASIGLAAENNSPQTRPTTAAQVSGQQSFQQPSSTATSTSPVIVSQATVVERASLVADSQTGGSEPNATNRGDTAGDKKSAAPDSSGQETTSSHDPAVQNVGEEPMTTRGQLHQTSTILPLLGLIGLGSLVAGFFARR